MTENDGMWYVSIEPLGQQAHGAAKLSVAITDAILAAEEKCNV